MSAESEAMDIVRKLAGASHPALGTAMGKSLLDLARTWVAAYGATQPKAVEPPPLKRMTK